MTKIVLFPSPYRSDRRRIAIAVRKNRRAAKAQTCLNSNSLYSLSGKNNAFRKTKDDRMCYDNGISVPF